MPHLLHHDVRHQSVVVRHKLQRAKAPHLGALGLLDLDADADALQAADLDAAAEEHLVQAAAAEALAQLGVALIPPRVAVVAVLLPARLEVGVLEVVDRVQGAVDGLDGVEVAGQDAGVDGGRVQLLRRFRELRWPQRRAGVEAFQVRVAEAQDALVRRRRFGGDVDVESIAVHLGVFVKGPEHPCQGQSSVDQGCGSVVRRFPVDGVDIGERKASTDPGGCLQEHEVIAHHLLEEDDQRHLSGECVDEPFQIAQSAVHAKWPTLSLGINVPCNEPDGRDGRRGELFVKRFPATTGEGMRGLRRRFRVRIGHANLWSYTHDGLFALEFEVKKEIWAVILGGRVGFLCIVGMVAMTDDIRLYVGMACMAFCAGTSIGGDEADHRALKSRLLTSSSGVDPREWENAVCKINGCVYFVTGPKGPKDQRTNK